MSEIELVVPFCLPPAHLQADVLQGLALPALASLLSFGKFFDNKTVTTHEFLNSDAQLAARSLPHERWLCHYFGIDGEANVASSPPIAGLLYKTFMSQELSPGYWFVLQPVHYHIARDHLVLTDSRSLMLSDGDARVLFDDVASYISEAGCTAYFGRADTWFLHADQYSDLMTSTPDATCGHNIDIWTPQGPSARSWRRLQNEIQMVWHDHPVNKARSAAGFEAINSVWLWGGSRVSVPPRSPVPTPAIQDVALFNFSNWLEAFGSLAASHRVDASAVDVLVAPAQRKLVWCDDLSSPSLAGDWATWRDCIQVLEARWFAPLLESLKKGQIRQLSLQLSSTDSMRQISTTSLALKKFWVRPTLARLCL